jgi:hypothetical protein
VAVKHARSAARRKRRAFDCDRRPLAGLIKAIDASGAASIDADRVFGGPDDVWFVCMMQTKDTFAAMQLRGRAAVRALRAVLACCTPRARAVKSSRRCLLSPSDRPKQDLQAARLAVFALARHSAPPPAVSRATAPGARLLQRSFAARTGWQTNGQRCSSSRDYSCLWAEAATRGPHGRQPRACQPGCRVGASGAVYFGGGGCGATLSAGQPAGPRLHGPLIVGQAPAGARRVCVNGGRPSAFGGPRQPHWLLGGPRWVADRRLAGPSPQRGAGWGGAKQERHSRGRRRAGPATPRGGRWARRPNNGSRKTRASF